ncbi:MAG: prolyl oligopeptidase family serine peptidase [Chlamydiia bacterium]|nr:prolyl oligopeptidase family serine peptidase [Chlamydiia bacterium]
MNTRYEQISVAEEGVIGTLFMPEKEGAQPVVITLGGFRGGISSARAEWLAAQGIASLALAYFGAPGLPSTIHRIPLEFMERACHWLERQQGIDITRLALWGASRGAELALLLATVMPEKFRAVAAHLPSSALYGSIYPAAADPAWIYRGMPLGPNAPFSPPAKVSAELALTPSFLEGMRELEAFAAAQIPVERMQCPLLLLSAQEDQMWPSALFAEQIVQRLKERGSSIPCTHISYPGAGHGISFSDQVTEFHPILKLWVSFGGNVKDNAYALGHSWNQTRLFFRQYLLGK